MFQRKTIHMITEDVAIIPEGSMLDSNLYIIGNAGNLMLIDSGNGMATSRILSLIKNQYGADEIQAILQTHYHIDHILGLYQFKKKFPEIKVYAHEVEAKVIEAGDNKYINPMVNMFMGPLQKVIEPIAKLFGINPEPVKVDIKLKEDDIINWGSLSLRVIHTPGHTPGGICLHDKKKKILFTGDTVFTHGSFGRVDFIGGSAELLQKSLKKLADLEDVEILLPGHMQPIIKDGRKHLKLASSLW
ncbi:MAG: MBL fold metallo-hydrolase [Candidatus Helarchaeota archaeon]|nr:MBL fold metallo-hydrolase [Candidatus Helarchaeota archaeon]